MLDDILNNTRTHVFREIEKEGEIFFEHFLTDDGKSLYPAFILSSNEHFERLHLD